MATTPPPAKKKRIRARNFLMVELHEDWQRDLIARAAAASGLSMAAWARDRLFRLARKELGE